MVEMKEEINVGRTQDTPSFSGEKVQHVVVF